ncbi:MAG: NERD domain-containing protein [Candidatus Lokiarchaeia archaeon]
MVHKYPPTIEEMKGRRERVPASEIKFYEVIEDLSDDWHVWHSIRWDKKRGTGFGEADFLLFNPNYGFLVIEVKGGIITLENNNFYTTNTITGKKIALDTDPFDQAENSTRHILRFYIQRTRRETNKYDYLKSNGQFPLNFSFGVFFPKCKFKQGHGFLQYTFDKVIDESDLEKQDEWIANGKVGICPIEKFLIKLLDRFKGLRELKTRVEQFFLDMVGSDISILINLEKYYGVREEELENINQVQDFLLDALSKKLRCIFQGSAGSGKTYIAMKKALKNDKEGLNTLLLCFNSELRISIQNYLSEKLGVPYEKLKGRIDVLSIHQYFRRLVGVMCDSDTERKLNEELDDFQYGHLANYLHENKDQIPVSYLYEAILIDEAQDMDRFLWDIFTYFLKDQKKSLFYVFYDEAQAIFKRDFSPEYFGMDIKSDLIVLNQNLRNTVEIAKWLKKKTKFGYYENFSGINGFKISSYNFSSAEEAILQTIAVINKKYYDQGISPDKIVILSKYKLKTLSWDFKNTNLKKNEYCDYIFRVDRTSHRKIAIVEPKNISLMNDIKTHKEIKCEWCTMFKTIGSFKGLESDILFLIIPNLKRYKAKHPEDFNDFLMEIYVGASRAKFKLYFFEYEYKNDYSYESN